ncbi:hypothetical protein QTP70_016132, partial [Hemibagrus guttatus]
MRFTFEDCHHSLKKHTDCSHAGVTCADISTVSTATPTTPPRSTTTTKSVVSRTRRKTEPEAVYEEINHRYMARRITSFTQRGSLLSEEQHSGYEDVDDELLSVKSGMGEKAEYYDDVIDTSDLISDPGRVDPPEDYDDAVTAGPIPDNRMKLRIMMTPLTADQKSVILTEDVSENYDDAVTTETNPNIITDSRSAHVSVGGVAPQCSFRGGRCLTRRQRRRVWQHPAPALPPLGEFQFPVRQTSSPRSRRSSVDVARCECSAVDVAWSCGSAVDVIRLCGSAVDVIRLCGSAVDVIQLCGSAVDLVRRLRSAVDVASDPLALPSGPLLPPLVSLLLLTPPTCLALILVPPTCLALILVPPTCLALILVPPTCLALVLASPHSPCFCFSLPPLVPRPASRSPHRPLYVPSSSPGPIAGPDFLGGAR